MATQAAQQVDKGAEGQPDAAWKMRMDFTIQAFNNAQALNRAIDTKAHYLIAAVGIMTAALGILVSGTLSTRLDFTWPGMLRVIGVVLVLSYLLTAFGVIYPATQVYRALANVLRPDTPAPGMIFPLMLLQRFTTNGRPSEEVYLDRLATVTPQEMLHDYASQVLELSNIYQYKQAQINMSITRFQWLSALWAITTMLLVIIIVFLPRS